MRSTAILCSRISPLSFTAGRPGASHFRIAGPPMLSTRPLARSRSSPPPPGAPSVSTSWNLTDELPQLRTRTFTRPLWHGVHTRAEGRPGGRDTLGRDHVRPVASSVEARPISSLIASAEGGDRSAADALFAALYSGAAPPGAAPARREGARPDARHHHAAARGLPRHRRPRGRRVPRPRPASWPTPARVMRGLIIDYARSRKAQKRGGRFEITSLDADVADPAGRRPGAGPHRRGARRAGHGRRRRWRRSWT